ncbi:MAG: glycosyltransferase, partial [Planctomycetota bacterium]
MNLENKYTEKFEIDNTPMFSILVPTYNQAKYLPEALDSLIKQTCDNWEALVVNDGSADETAEVMSSYAQKDKRIRIFHKENAGVASALNDGLQHARGQWICWLSSDDLFEPDKLEIHLQAIRQNPAIKFFHSHFSYLDEKTGKISKPNTWHPIPQPEFQISRLLVGPYIHGNSIAIHRSVFDDVGLFNEAYRQAQDFDMWLRVSAKYESFFINHRTCVTRKHSEQDTQGFPEGCFYDSCRACTEFLNLHKFSEFFPRLDLNTWDGAAKAVRETLTVAVNRHSVMYECFLNTSLLESMGRWLCQYCPDNLKRALIPNLRESINKILVLPLPAGLKETLKKLQVGNISDFCFSPRDFIKETEQNAQRLSLTGQTKKACSLKQYLSRIKSNEQNLSSDIDEKLKILFYYDGLSDFDKNLGGTVIAVLSFAEMLLHSRPAAEIHLTGAHVQHHRQYESFQVIPLPQEDKRDEFIADYDVVFFVTHFRYFKGIARPPGQIWVLYQHCWDMAGGALARMSDFDAVLCLSEAHANELSRYGVPAQKQIIVPNLVDTDSYCPQDVERKGHSIMYAGAIHEHKGVHILLDAFRLVRQVIGDIELHIYGSRSMWTGTDDYEDRIKAAKTEGVYFHGYIDKKDMPQIYSQHSILCLPSKLESFGLVTVEAQACGCIPVVHNAGGAVATLLDDQTGFLYSPNTKEELGGAILKAIRAVDANSSIRRRAIDFVRDNFSMTKAKHYISKLWDRFAIAGEVNAVRALFERNDIESAGVECGRLLRKYPEHPDLLLLEALIRLHQGDTGKCKSMLLDLTKKFDRHQMAINNLGVLLMNEGQQAEALKSFIKALNINPYDRNTMLNCSLALKACDRHKEAKTALLNYLSKVGEDAQVLLLLREIDNLIKDADSKPHIGSQQLSEKREREHTKQGRTGIIVFGHTRPLLLQNVLESLRRQGTTNDVHVWLDGHQGRASLIKPVQQCIELVKTQFPQVCLRTMNGNVGIEKLMIDGLGFMASCYERIIVLEDDCFPTSCAIKEFEKALDEIEQRPEVYSVYGHHFLTESEGDTITRFQGWGWATVRDKLLPVLAEMKKCFAMCESDYLQWARKNLTPEVIKRLDVTPGRNCVRVIASQFCWDGCTCLVTAMQGLVHKKTARRVIYNCGMGDGSMHFPLNDKFRQPPFNMIAP